MKTIKVIIGSIVIFVCLSIIFLYNNIRCAMPKKKETKKTCGSCRYAIKFERQGIPTKNIRICNVDKTFTSKNFVKKDCWTYSKGD